MLSIVQSSTLVQCTQYSMKEVRQCLRDLIVMVSNFPSLSQQAIREKYKDVK